MMASANKMKQDVRAAILETPLGKDKLVISKFDGSEGLSELFVFRIDCLSPEKDLDFDQAIGKNCTVTMKTVDGNDRYFDGILVEAFNTGVKLDAFSYQLVLRPWFWLLSQQTDNFIFSEQTAPEIISTIFGKHGFAVFSDQLTRSYPTMEYTVQYRESDMHFVCRLMEQHGISYYFKHEQGSHTLVLSDEMSCFTPIQGATRKFIAVGKQHRAHEERFYEWATERRFTSGKSTYQDYNFKQPGSNLKAEKSGTNSYENGELELYDYPGKYIDQTIGKNYSQSAIDEIMAQDSHSHAVGDCMSCFPGSLVTLEEHPNDATNTEYLAIHCRHLYYNDSYRTGLKNSAESKHVELALGNLFQAELRRLKFGPRSADHRGGSHGLFGQISTIFEMMSAKFKRIDDKIVADDDDGRSEEHEADESYEGHFEFVRTDQPYAPPVKTQKPYIRGPQTGKVVGPDGEEIHTDEHGRIRVRFHWDREEDQSRWCRVAQVWSGKGWGGMYIPRIGMEVIVQFLEGDPDLPVVIGTVYNGDNQPPYELPANKTIAGIKTNSSLGGGGYNEYIFEDKKGEELIRVQAEKDMDTLIKNDETRKIEHDRTTVINNDESHTVDQHLTFSIGDKKKGSRTGDIKIDDTLKVGKKIYVEAGVEIKFVVGGSSIKMTSTEIVITSPNVKIVAGAEFKSTATMSKHSAAAIMDIKGSLVKIN